MVFDWEYTEAEYQRVEAIHDKYDTQLAKLYDERRKYTNDSAGYKHLTERWDNTNAQLHAELNQAYTDIEQAHFDQLGGDLQRILEDAKRQVSLILKMHYDYMKTYDLVKAPDGTWQSRNSDPKIESQTAAAMIRNGIYLHLQALKADKQLRKELRDYYESYISTSSYTYTDTSKVSTGEVTVDQVLRSPLPPVNTYGLMNDKINKALVSADSTQQAVDGQLRLIWGINQASKNEPAVPVYVAMRYDGTETHISKRLTAFDTAVYNTVSTLFYYHRQSGEPGPLYVTPQEVWRTMNGIKDKRKPPTSKQLTAVCRSMDKMRFTNFYMDISEEIKAQYITFEDERIVGGTIDTYLLKADKVTFTTEKGKEVCGYRIDNEPIMYSYNAAKKHVLFVDYDLLDTSDTTGNEGYTVEIRNYLLQQIQSMYNGYRNNNRILYSTVYDATAIPTPADRVNRTKYTNDHSYQNAVNREAGDDREKIAAILKSWKDKKWIVDYSQVKKGRTNIGVDIVLDKKKMKQLTTKN